MWLSYHAGLELSTGGTERGAGTNRVCAIISPGPKAPIGVAESAPLHGIPGVQSAMRPWDELSRRTVMKRSTDRILTTFCGEPGRVRLDLLEMMHAREHGQPYDHEAYAGSGSRRGRPMWCASKSRLEWTSCARRGARQNQASLAYVSERLAGFEPRGDRVTSGAHGPGRARPWRSPSSHHGCPAGAPVVLPPPSAWFAPAYLLQRAGGVAGGLSTISRPPSGTCNPKKCSCQPLRPLLSNHRDATSTILRKKTISMPSPRPCARSTSGIVEAGFLACRSTTHGW